MSDIPAIVVILWKISLCVSVRFYVIQAFQAAYYPSYWLYLTAVIFCLYNLSCFFCPDACGWFIYWAGVTCLLFLFCLFRFVLQYMHQLSRKNCWMFKIGILKKKSRCNSFNVLKFLFSYLSIQAIFKDKTHHLIELLYCIKITRLKNEWHCFERISKTVLSLKVLISCWLISLKIWVL